MDEEAAEVVRQIFRWTMEGFGPYQICCKLREAKVEIPGLHLKRHGQGLHQKKEWEASYAARRRARMLELNAAKLKV